MKPKTYLTIGGILIVVLSQVLLLFTLISSSQNNLKHELTSEIKRATATTTTSSTTSTTTTTTTTTIPTTTLPPPPPPAPVNTAFYQRVDANYGGNLKKYTPAKITEAGNVACEMWDSSPGMELFVVASKVMTLGISERDLANVISAMAPWVICPITQAFPSGPNTLNGSDR